MFGALKRLIHRGGDEDYDELRSHILGERVEPLPFEQPPPERFGPEAGQNRFAQGPGFQQTAPYEEFSPKTRDIFEPFTTGPSMQPSRPELERAAEKTGRDYEILDRLDMIESQLAVIRSQTETINERLKNLEGKLGLQRRY